MASNLAESGGKTTENRWFSWSILGLIALGIALRAAQYLHNRALWLDEAALAVNIVERNFGQLLEPMIYHQNSPYAFLFSVKTATLVFGTSEFGLRLVPIVMAIASVPLFYLFVARVSDRAPLVVLIGLLFFATGKHLIFYSNELRHYSTDVAIVCLVYWLCIPILKMPSDDVTWMRRVLILFIVGLIVNWFSLVALLVLGAVGLVLYADAGLRRDWRAVGVLSLVGVGWLMNFYLHISIHNLNFEARNLRGDMIYNLRHAFAPFPPQSLSDMKWYREAFEFYFYLPGGFTFRGLAGFTFLAGCVAMCNRNRWYAALLILPILFALGASILDRYPFWGRYVIFLMPAMIVLVAEGANVIAKLSAHYSRAIPAALILILFAQPVAHGMRVLVQSYDFGDDPRPLASYVAENFEAGDIVYLPFHQTPPFHYYLPRAGLGREQFETEPIFTEITEGNEEFRKDYRLMRLPELYAHFDRVWIPFRHGTSGGPPYPEQVGEVDEIGRQLEVIPGEGMTLYLYEAP